MISEVVSFVFRFMLNWQNKRKRACKKVGKVQANHHDIFKSISSSTAIIAELCTGIFKVPRSNAWTNMWKKMMEEKSRGQKGEFQKRI